MNRLTHERSNGIKTGYWSPAKKDELIARLAEYEDTGLSPEEVEKVNKFEDSNGQKYLLEVAKHRWIPVSERLPEADEKILVTVKHSSWIADFHLEWVPEKDKVHHPETNDTYIGYINENGVWIFVDEEGEENICDEEIGKDIGNVYDVAIAWKPLPEPYKGE